MAPWARVSGSSTPVTSTLASGNASRNSAMNGIEPPTPMSIGSVPSQASVKAARAASYAGPVASICVGSPKSTGVIVSSAPHGTWVSRWRSRAARALATVSPGAIRRLSRARAAGTRVLLEPATLGASRPITDSDGLVQSRSTLEPLPIQPTLRRSRRTRPGGAPRGSRRRPRGRRTSPSTATLPSSSWRRGDQAGQGHHGVGDEAAPHAGVDGVGEGADLDVEPDQAAQAGGEGRDADVPVAAVGDHDHVGAELVEVLLQQGREAVGPDLLLALDEHHHVDRQVVAVDPEGAEVGGDAGLVVGGAAGVEAPVALGRLERRRVPVGVVVLGLDVVVGVEQDRLSALLPRALVRDHGRPAAVGAGDLRPRSPRPRTGRGPPRRCAAPRRLGRGRRSPTRSGPGPRGRVVRREARRAPARGGRSRSCSPTYRRGSP